MGAQGAVPGADVEGEVKVVPVVIGALGAVTLKLKEWLQQVSGRSELD